MLAALADRAGRELPVAADFVAARVDLAPGQSLALQRGDDGLLSLTIEDDHA
jgi:pyrimidine operon attenuation protein/uracil phosphoribosyltransferase